MNAADPRPLLAECRDAHDLPPHKGHIWPVGGGYYHPCRGCGVEFSALPQYPCPAPWKAPDEVPTMTAVLVEIRDILAESRTLLRAIAEAQGVDFERCGTPFGALGRCTLQRGHEGEEHR